MAESLSEKRTESILDKIAKANDLRTKKVEVPEWGVTLVVKEMTAAEREQYEAGYTNKAGKKGFDASVDSLIMLISHCCTDESGHRLFNSDEGRELLKAKSSARILSLFQECLKINSLTKEEVDGLEKNSETAQSEDSTSD